MILKDGTQFDQLDSNILMAAIVADGVWQELGVVTGVTLTSGTDGRHSTGSLHYEGKAIDCRVWNLPKGREQADEAARILRKRLNGNYDVIAEKLGDGQYSHIHVEFDPT